MAPMYALTCKRIQIEHVVMQINSRKYSLHQFEKLNHDLWLIVYFGTELIQIAKMESIEPLEDEFSFSASN